jgi:hypothetical protein
MSRLPVIATALAVLAAAASPLAAASSFTVTYTLSDGVVTVLNDGGTITFPAVDINASTTATIDVANQGPDTGSVSVSLSGTAFHLAGTPALPATLTAGQSVRFSVVFAPTQVGSYSGSLRITLPGSSLAIGLRGSTASANITLAYIDPDTNNVISLRDGATLTLPSTAVGSSASVTLIANNSGAGTGVIDSVVLNATPSVLQLVNLPALPAAVPPAQQLRFAVRFTPQQQQTVSGTILVSINGQAFTINLVAQGAGPQFTYVYGSGTSPLAPGGTLAVADTTVGQTTSIPIVVSNNGNGDGQIPSITITGAGLSVSDLPVTIPFTLHAGASQAFTLNFAPSQPGSVNGRLIIGKDAFTVAALGLGPRLTFSFANSAPPVPVAEGGSVIFPPTAVGNNAKLQFLIQNSGTSAATLSSIDIAVPSANFSLEQLPALPLRLNPGDNATLAVNFTPSTTGGLTATLRVNSSMFTLSGSGTQPAAIPSYAFQASAGSAKPAQQPSISLGLSTPYPLPVQGTLKLTFVSDVFTDDPAIQFATGGRTVNFTIPANSTQASFNGNSSIALQTGTTAGTIVVTPSFAMLGGFDMTPSAPDTLTLAIPRTAPQLLGASITSQTTAGFTLVLNGYTTTRSLRQIDVQFTPKQGESFSTTRLTIDVNATASSWFQSTASQAAGGSFLAAIPFVLQNGSSTDDLVHRLQSLSITATNETGTSSALAVTIP